MHEKLRILHIQFEGSQYHTRFPDKDYLKIKRELPKYDGKGHKDAIVWVNKMDAIFRANPPIGEQEKIMTASNYLEAEAYDWFLWWSNKCAIRSFNWKKFKSVFLKRFHDEEEDDVYERFIHLKQKGLVSEYIHEWEVLAIRQRGFSDEELLKMYRCGLKDYIQEELKLYKPQTIEDARHAAIIIGRKYKLHKASYASNEKSNSYSKGKSSKLSSENTGKYVPPPMHNGGNQ